PLPTPRSSAVRDPQIPIGALAKRSPNLPAVSSLGGFRAPAPSAVPPSQRAGARNPSPKHAFKVGLLDGREGRESGHRRYEEEAPGAVIADRRLFPARR